MFRGRDQTGVVATAGRIIVPVYQADSEDNGEKQVENTEYGDWKCSRPYSSFLSSVLTRAAADTHETAT